MRAWLLNHSYRLFTIGAPITAVGFAMTFFFATQGELDKNTTLVWVGWVCFLGPMLLVPCVYLNWGVFVGVSWCLRTLRRDEDWLDLPVDSGDPTLTPAEK